MTQQPQGDSPQSLGFARKKGLPLGPILALALSGALAAWMYSGTASQHDAAAPEQPGAGEGQGSAATATQGVRVTHSKAYEAARRIPADGETRARHSASLSARLSGFIETRHVAKGDKVKAGDPLITLSVPDFAARAMAAEVHLEEARRALDKNTQLNAKGLSTEDALRSARTALASAEADWAAIEEEREDMVLRAPFAGTIAEIEVETGESVANGATLVEILDLSTLIVEIRVPQADISQVILGEAVSVKPVGYPAIKGRVHYISPRAESATRSFPVEIEIDNSEGEVLAGMSASVTIPGARNQVHDIPSAYLSLSSEGDLLVKTVEDGRVRAWPVEMISSGMETVQVRGLPDEAMIITVGQGFVRDGDPVKAEEIQ